MKFSKFGLINYFIPISLLILSCSGGYTSFEYLIEPDLELCFVTEEVQALKAAEIVLDKKECGSLRYSKLIIEENAVSEDVIFTLRPSTDIINPPSSFANFSLEISSVPQVDFEGVYIDTPYVDSTLFQKNYDAIDLVSSYKGAESAPTFLSRSLSEKDDEKKRIKTLIEKPGIFQPGVRVEAAMALGEVRDFDFGNGESSYILPAYGNEAYVFMLTGFPATYFLDPESLSPTYFTFTLGSSAPHDNVLSRIAFDSNNEFEEIVEPSSFDSDYVIRQLFLDKIQQAKAEKLTVSPKAANISAPVYSLGDRITGLYVLDCSTGCTDFLSDQEAVVTSIGVNALAFYHDSDLSYDSLTQQEKDDIAAFTDNLVDDFDNIIHPRDTLFFGEPSDVDNNGMVIIFVTDTLLDTGVLGYFWQGDTFTNLGETNLADIIYVTAEDAGVSELLVKSTIAHEYQHLINNNNKTLKNYPTYEAGTPVTYLTFGTSPLFEDLGINEGLSHFAEDVAGYADVEAGIAHILNHPNPDAFPYLKNNHRSSLVSTSNTFSMRGQNYLYLRYLFEQAGGANFNNSTKEWEDTGGIEFIRELIASSSSGLENLNTLFPQYDSNQREFMDSFMDWLVTLYNDKFDESLSALPEYNYEDPLPIGYVNPGQIAGIDLSSTRTLADSPEEVQLDGPTVHSFSQGLNSYTASAISLGATYVEFGVPESFSDDLIRFTAVATSSYPLARIMRVK